MLKKTTAVILAVCMLASGGIAYGEGEGTQETAVSPVKTFTLNEAVTYALENGKDVRDADEAIKKARVALNSAEDTYRKAKKTKDAPIVRDYDISERALNGYFVKQAEQAVLLAEKQKEQTKEKVKYDLEKLFYDIQASKSQISYLKDSIARMEKQIIIEELKLKLNMSTQLVFDSVKVQKEALDNQLSNLEYALANLYTLLKTKLDLDQAAVIEIADEPLTYQEYPLKSLEEAYNLALENRINILAAKFGVELVQFDFDLVKTRYSRGFSTYRNLEIDLRKAKDDYDLLLSVTKDQLKLRADDVLIKKSEYLNKKEALEKAESNYKIAQIKYSLGLISKIDLMDEELALSKAKIDEMTSLQKYNLSYKMYELSYGYGY